MVRRGIAVAALVALVSGCVLVPVAARRPTTPPSAGVDSAPGSTGWHRVAIDGSVRGINRREGCGDRPPHLLAVGVRGARPFLVDVTYGVARTIPIDPPDRDGRGADVVVSDGQTLAVAGHGEPDRPATLWAGATEAFGGMSLPPETSPQDEQHRRPAWLWPLLDGEEDFRAVGAVFAAGRWELRVWRAMPAWERIDRAPQLYLPAGAAPGVVLAGSTEGAVVVAGPITDRPAPSGAAPAVWSIEDPLDDTSRWQRERLATDPDGLTDVSAWEVGWWAAGHRRLRPVVYDFDSARGASLPVPDTRLDPAHPAVYIADQPISAPMMLATQSVDGPTVWIAGAGAGWTRLPGPSGRLAAAQCAGDAVYLLIDGALWYRRLPGR